MTTPELHYLSAREARELFLSRRLSPVELMEATITRIEAVDPKVNALPVRFFDEALHQAREAEARFTGGGPRPRVLEGIPIAVKEEAPIAGQPWTQGSLVYEDEIATETALFAQRIIAAGGIVHARSTAPEFSCAPITESRLWGITRNPWNLEFSPGGSSGGSAAALAAGMATLASGADIGGSIRIPASFCGVVGFKPPYGRVPEDPPFNLDHYCHVGPMARTVEDCRLFENVIAGPHPRDIVSLRPKLVIPARPSDSEGSGVEGWKIALSLDLGCFDVSAEVRAAVLRAAETFRELGASVEEIDLGWSYEGLVEATRAHFGAIFGSWIAEMLADHREQMTPYAIEFAEGAIARPTVSFYRGLEIEGEIYARLGAILQRFRLLICPTTAVPALPAGRGYGIDAVYDKVMTYPFNICGRCPVMVVPVERGENGVPIGMQIVGRTYADVSVFRAAAAFEAAVPLSQRAPLAESRDS